MNKVQTDIEIYIEVLNRNRLKFPRNFWKYCEIPNLEAAKNISKYLIEDILQWDDEQIKKQISIKTFRDNKLGGMLQIIFDNSPFKVIDYIYPGKFKEWELPITPRTFWDSNTAKEATIWLIETKLQWSDEQVKKNLNIKIFHENGFRGMLTLFNNSVFDTLNNAYPNKFKEWELASTPRNFWNLEKAKFATIWLIEEKLQWNEEQIKQNFNTKILSDNGLYGMLHLFNGSPYQTLNNAYPNRFKEWELAHTSRNFWNQNTAKKAIIWLIETKLQWDEEQIKENWSTKTLADNGLITILRFFNNSPYQVLNNVYPNRFKPSDLKNSPRTSL